MVEIKLGENSIKPRNERENTFFRGFAFGLFMIKDLYFIHFIFFHTLITYINLLWLLGVEPHVTVMP